MGLARKLFSTLKGYMRLRNLNRISLVGINFRSDSSQSSSVYSDHQWNCAKGFPNCRRRNRLQFPKRKQCNRSRIWVNPYAFVCFESLGLFLFVISGRDNVFDKAFKVNGVFRKGSWEKMQSRLPALISDWMRILLVLEPVKLRSSEWIWNRKLAASYPRILNGRAW